MIGPQDEINKRRSRALHLINERQLRISPATGMDAAAARKELSNPRGVFVGEAGEIEILPTNDMAGANLQLLQEAKSEIDLLGPNAALSGKNEQSQSGRAILAQQQGGMTEAATYLDRLRVLSLAVYRSVWCRVQQFWTEERWVRVTDSDKNMKFVGVNQPLTMLQAMANDMGITKENMGQADPQALAMLQQFANDPRAQQVIAVENNVSELDVDITVDEGIDTPTIAAEEFDSLLRMAGTGMVQIPADVLIEASSLRNKDRLLEMLKQEPDPAMEQMKQMAMAMEAAKIEKTQSETAKNTATAQATTAGVQMDAMQMGMAHAA